MSAAPALTKPEANVVVQVGQQVRTYLERKTLHLPEDYAVENALKSAYLALQEVKDRNGKPALECCTKASIANALLDMVVQGLNPAKKQLYFIVYGNQLTCQRSYFGDQALAQRIQPNIEIIADVVYNDDTFEYSKIRGKNIIEKHLQKIENVNPSKIKAAYCTIYDKETGEDLGAEIMTWEQITKSWGMSKTYQPSGNKGTHHEFPDQMALRTVIRRRCKPIINSSSDSLLMESISRQDEEKVLAQVDEEESIMANAEIIDIQPQIAAQAEVVAEVEEPETAESAAELPPLADLIAELKLSEDTVNFLADQLKDAKEPITLEQFLVDCKTQGFKTVAQFKAAATALVPKDRGF